MTPKRNSRLLAIYTTPGDTGGFLRYPYIFNRQGEWIGWVTSTREVYSVHGHYVGWLNDDPRILRKPSSSYDNPRRDPPPIPQPISAPATIPLAPMMAELSFGTIDVLDESPELLPFVDTGDLRDDME